MRYPTLGPKATPPDPGRDAAAAPEAVFLQSPAGRPPRSPEGSLRNHGDHVAAAVNLAWSLERERRARQERPVDPMEALDQRLERLEAALFGLWLHVTDVESTADLAAERAAVVETWR